MDPAEDVFLRLRIDGRTLFHHTTEGRLDMAARAAEPVIQIKVAEGGIEVILKQPVHHPAADPDAFRVAGGAGHLLGHLRKIVNALAFLFGIGLWVGRLLFGLVPLVRIALGQSGSSRDRKSKTQGRQELREARRHDGG